MHSRTMHTRTRKTGIANMPQNLFVVKVSQSEALPQEPCLKRLTKACGIVWDIIRLVVESREENLEMATRVNRQLELIDDGQPLEIKSSFSIENRATVYRGDCLDFLKTIPDSSIQLVVTSPPYNIGKEYEKSLDIEEYVSQQQLLNMRVVLVRPLCFD